MTGSATERGLLGTLGAIVVLLVMAPGAGAITASNTTAISPPDDGSSQSVSPVTISGQAGTVSSVRVVLELPGIDAPGDVDMLLVGPGGQSGIVMSDACGGGSFSNAGPLTFVTGVSTVPDNCGTGVVGATYGPTDVDLGPDTFLAPAPAGPYPTGFGAFAGASPNGTWTLYTIDDTPGMNTAMFIGGGWTLDLGIAAAPAPAPKKKCKKGKKLKKGKCVKKKKKKGKKK